MSDTSLAEILASHPFIDKGLVERVKNMELEGKINEALRTKILETVAREVGHIYDLRAEELTAIGDYLKALKQEVQKVEREGVKEIEKEEHREEEKGLEELLSNL